MRKHLIALAIPVFIGLATGAVARAAAKENDLDPQGLSRLKPGEVLVLGEVHGSKETPAAFLALVDNILTRARVVSVGLEMPSNATAAVCGAETPGTALGSFWTRKTQDGRSSQAMRDMVCQLKKRAAKGRVRLVYLDTIPRNSDEMARRVAAELAAKSHPMAILIGNFHARNAPTSFTERLRAAGLKVTSLTASSPDATTWNCTQDGCAARPMQMNFCPDKPTGQFLLTKMPTGGRWDACMVLPRLTSSPPLPPTPTS